MRDKDTKDLLFADVTDSPEFWDLPNYIESENQSLINSNFYLTLFLKSLINLKWKK